MANCRTGASTWPSGLFAYDSATSPKSAHLAQVLIDPGRETKHQFRDRWVGDRFADRYVLVMVGAELLPRPPLQREMGVEGPRLYVATPTNAVDAQSP